MFQHALVVWGVHLQQKWIAQCISIQTKYKCCGKAHFRSSSQSPGGFLLKSESACVLSPAGLSAWIASRHGTHHVTLSSRVGNLHSAGFGQIWWMTFDNAFCRFGDFWQCCSDAGAQQHMQKISVLWLSLPIRPKPPGVVLPLQLGLESDTVYSIFRWYFFSTIFCHRTLLRFVQMHSFFQFVVIHKPHSAFTPNKNPISESVQKSQPSFHKKEKQQRMSQRASLL